MQAAELIETDVFSHLSDIDIDKLHTFTDSSLQTRALTLPVASTKNYEQLEWLGDRILAYHLSAIIHSKYPDCELKKRNDIFSILVSAEMLNHLAMVLGLNYKHALPTAYIQHSKGKNRNYFGDMLEAMFAAIELDSDPAKCKQIIEFIFTPAIDILWACKDSLNDYKSQLIDFCYNRKLPTPTYNLRETSGPAHNPTFQVDCYLNKMLISTNSATRKKQAEQLAAKLALSHLNNSQLG